MKFAKMNCITAIGLFVLLALPLQLAAQDKEDKHNHHHYQFLDLGTFGGPVSYISNRFDGVLNGRETALGWADTSTPDPFPAFPLQSRRFRFSRIPMAEGHPDRSGHAPRRRQQPRSLDHCERIDTRKFPER